MKKTILATGMLPLALSAQTNTELKKQHPNLVLIIADEFRGQALGCLGLEKVQTPNLDKLASEGVNFTNSASCYPLSSPARGMLMTGMYPYNNHVTGNCNSTNDPYGVEMSADAVCWSDILKAQGYSTAYIGKLHLDSPKQPYVNTSNNEGGVAWNEWCPPSRRHGFDYWMAYGTYDEHLHPMYWATKTPRDSFFYVNQWGPEYEADRAIDYIDNKDHLRETNAPFAMVVSMNPPHMAYDQVPGKYKAIYKDMNVESFTDKPDIEPKGTKWGDHFRKSIKNYYACITGVDEQIGRIISELKRKGLYENTLIIFTSDHGDCMGTHQMDTKNNPYEESMRTPMIIVHSGQIKPRVDNKLPIGIDDLYPTMLGLLGFENKIPSNIEVCNYTKAVKGLKQSVPTFKPYYMITPSDSLSGWRGIRGERYKLAIHFKKGVKDKILLFDLKNDPYEMTNLYQNKKLLNQQIQELKRWLEKRKDILKNYL